MSLSVGPRRRWCDIEAQSGEFVVFLLGDQRFAISLQAVERAVRAVEYTRLPDATEVVIGVINVEGEVVPLLDVRARFQIPGKEMDLSDHIVIARTGGRRVALLVDRVTGVIESAGGEMAGVSEVTSGSRYIEGILKTDEGMILVLGDLEELLSGEDPAELDKAVADED